MKKFTSVLLTMLLLVTIGSAQALHKQGSTEVKTVTSVAAALPTTVLGFSTVRLTLTGTYADANTRMEGSVDGTAFPFTLEMYRASDGQRVVSTGSLTNVTESFVVSVSGFSKVRLNCTAITSGTATFTVTPIAAPSGTSGNLAGVPVPDTTAVISVSTATTTQIVALSTSKKTFVSSFSIVGGGTGNIKFVYGTGTACGTGTTDLTGNYNLVAQSVFSLGSGIGAVLIVPAGQALCVTTSAAVQMSGHVTFTQF